MKKKMFSKTKKNNKNKLNRCTYNLRKKSLLKNQIKMQ